MHAIRRHIAIRIVTCLLLAWAAADLLVPGLCSSEAAVQDHGSAPTPQDQDDDCFCCCSHTEKAIAVAIAFTDGIPVVVERFPAESLAIGIPRSLYHPPLAS